MEAPKSRRGPKPRNVTDPVCIAIRELRQRLGESQQALAYRMKTAVRTIARWETVRPPKGRTLMELASVAQDAGYWDLRDQFRSALNEELRPSPEGLLSAISFFMGNSDAGSLDLSLMYRASMAETEYARAFLYAMGLLNSRFDRKGKAQAKRALRDFSKSVERIRRSAKPIVPVRPDFSEEP